MKAFLITLLAIIIVPLVFTYFQNAKYEKDLNPSLFTEVNKAVVASGVKNAEVSMDKLDVTISGIVECKNSHKILRETIDGLGGGAVRVVDSGYNIQVYGNADIKKVGSDVALMGKMSHPEAFLGKLNALELGGLGTVTASENLDHDGIYRDPNAFENEQLPEWTARYLGLQGDRGYRVSASDNVIKPYGQITPRMQKILVSSAAGMGLTVDTAGFERIAPKRAEFVLSNKGGERALLGKGSKTFDLGAAFNVSKNTLVADDFVEVHPSISNPAFSQWVGSYFGAKGERGMKVIHDEVILSGPVTKGQREQWMAELKGMGLKPKSQLTVYPSEYHFPGYQPDSKMDTATQKALMDAFALNQIFFDSGSSAVKADQRPKIDALVAAIKTSGDTGRFAIGGHADATGNAEFNKELSKKRAASVVEALAEKGISREIFSVVSFGAAKSSGGGSNESDRRVEIRIK